MKNKQSILEDFSEMELVSVKDITRPDQKYIHFWDFMDLDEKVHEFQARMGFALRDLKKNMMERYKNYYTQAYVQSPERFIRHNRELQEIEYLLENPFFLAVLHFTLTEDMDDRQLRYQAITYKKRLMDRRRGLKESLQNEIKESTQFLVR